MKKIILLLISIAFFSTFAYPPKAKAMMTMMEGDFSMMGYSSMMGWGGSFSILGLITWLALIAFLITGAVFFWKNSRKK